MSLLSDDFDIDQQVDESFFHLTEYVSSSIKDTKLCEDILSIIGPFRVIEDTVVFVHGYETILNNIYPLWYVSRNTKLVSFTIYCSHLASAMTIAFTERLMSGALTTQKIGYKYK